MHRLMLVLMSVAVAGMCMFAMHMPSSAPPRQRSTFVVVGYLPDRHVPSWSVDRMSPVTDLIYFGIRPRKDGHVPQESVDDQTLRKLKAIKKAANCRLLLCVGGYRRSHEFPVITLDNTKRSLFAEQLVQFCINNNFDGIDFDWEYPMSPEDMEGYLKLLTETKQAGKPHGLLVTIALATWKEVDPAIYQVVDRVHLMSYDNGYPHATRHKSRNDVQTLLRRGCPPNKLVLGVPFYGRNRQNEARSYARLIAQQSNLTTDRIDGFAFNGRDTIIAKLAMTRHLQLGGIMIWELGQDTTNPETSLLTTIANELSPP